MTEEEAKTKACFAPIGILLASPRGFEDAESRPFGICIGSACMAWRPYSDSRSEEVTQEQKPAGDGWHNTSGPSSAKRWRRLIPVPSGYCGLAGAPQ